MFMYYKKWVKTYYKKVSLEGLEPSLLASEASALSTELQGQY